MTYTSPVTRPAAGFLLTRPLRDVTDDASNAVIQYNISTHTPLAGRDDHLLKIPGDLLISTHTPLAGRDMDAQLILRRINDFYSHAPCGT